jgi:HEAT repeat protein/cytochrome c biogenesis protein CcdA/thioredoxin-related protein
MRENTGGRRAACPEVIIGGRLRLLLGLLALALPSRGDVPSVAVSAAPTPPPAAPAAPPPVAAAPAEPLVWLGDLDQAMASAEASLRPVFVLFTSPTCGWCTRLKQTTLQDAEVLQLLRQFVTAQINVVEDPRSAAAFNVTGVPLAMVLNSRGTPQLRLPGYHSASELQILLRQALNPAVAAPATPRTDELVRLLGAGPLPTERWPDLALALAEERSRDRILAALIAVKPQPIPQLAALLDDTRLAVRIGAIELLEELTGTNHGFDPWRTAEQLEANQEAIARFRASTDTNATHNAFFAFDAAQFAAYVQDLVSDNRSRAQRAARMLHRGGVTSTKALYEHLAANPGLPPASRQTIRELQYAIYLNSHAKADGDNWAHRLMAGSLDVRTQAVADLRQLGANAPPILRDFLDDANPLIRETAAEALAQAGTTGQIVPLFTKHLETERNREVIYRILTECRRFRTKTSLGLLLHWIAHENEDLAIAAIQSIAKLRTPDAEEPLLPGLGDPRWRVRLATLDAMRELNYGKHLDTLKGLLHDDDEFVRFKAVETLATVAKEASAEALAAAFLADDALKPAIAAAFSSLGQPLPDALLDNLRETPPHIVAATLAALERVSPAVIAYAVRCADHPDLDVSTAAVRLLSKHARRPDALPVVLRSLKSAKTEHVKAVLHALDLEENDYERTSVAVGSSTPDSLAPTSLLGALVQALFVGSDSEPATPSLPPVPPKVPADAVFADFGAAPPPEDAVETAMDPFASAASLAKRASPATRKLVEALSDVMRTHADVSVRDMAMAHLLGCASPEALPILEERLPHATVEERYRYAMSLTGYEGKQAEDLLRQLLADTSAQVRGEAAEALLRRVSKNPKWGTILLRELVRPNAVLLPVEAYSYGFENLREVGGKLLPDVRALLHTNHSAQVQLYGLLAAAVIAHKDLLPNVHPYLAHTDPVLRRAAWHAVGRTDKAAAIGRVTEIVDDPSELVREVALTLADTQPTSRGWSTYFDANTVRYAHVPYSYSYSSYENRGKKMPEALANALRKLTADPFTPLRAKSFFALLGNRVPVDLTELVATLDRIPDADVASSLAADFVEQNLDTIGPKFRVLLPYLRDRLDDNEWFAKRLAQKFPESAAEGDSAEIADLTLAPRPVAAAAGPQFAAIDVSEPATAADGVAPEDRPVSLLLFTTAGCSDCERVKRTLPDMRRLFKNLSVQTYDLREVRTMLLNESLSEQFGVPMQQRLVAPALFTRAGFLIRHDIRPDATAALIARATAVDDGSDSWYRVDEKTTAQADKRIVGRQEAFHFTAVVLAALADGVNPCAFATIVFLLSYLQVTRRTPRQIIRIGLGFIAGVFVAYFLLGLGLAELATKLHVLQRLGQALTYGLAAFALVLMVLSLRDGILCLRGRMGDMTLQLPLVLKQHIHSAIRAGARQSHLVLAAFATGVTVSVLELACTGQVYLPTILYILKTGREPGRALGLLTTYNVAFVLPLCFVFLLACRGLTSDSLRRALERHAATVKFATAALFLALVLFLLFGHRLLAR